MKHKMLKPYMETARAFARLSHAERKKVGAIAVTPQDIVIYSWNGRPAGDDNCCEVEVGHNDWPGFTTVTHPDVLHAESNLVAKAAREGISLKDSTIVVTLSPCLACAKQLYQAGVATVIYEEEYRLTDGIDFLRKRHVHVQRYSDNE